MDALNSLGKDAVSISCHNASMCYSVINGRFVAVILYSVRKTLAEWCSNNQASVGAAYCRSE